MLSVLGESSIDRHGESWGTLFVGRRGEGAVLGRPGGVASGAVVRTAKDEADSETEVRSAKDAVAGLLRAPVLGQEVPGECTLVGDGGAGYAALLLECHDGAPSPDFQTIPSAVLGDAAGRRAALACHEAVKGRSAQHNATVNRQDKAEQEAHRRRERRRHDDCHVAGCELNS